MNGNSREQMRDPAHEVWLLHCSHTGSGAHENYLELDDLGLIPDKVKDYLSSF
jgi:hypothetical protein